MGNAASIDSMRNYEDDISKFGEKELDKGEIDSLFGASIGNMKLFDLLKDEGTGKVYPSDLREMIRARRRVAENRKNANIVKTEGIGGKKRNNLVQEITNTESNLNRVIQEKAQFQQSICAATSSGRPVTAAVVKENAAKLEEYAKMEKELVKEHKEAQQTLHSLRREELAKAAKDRAERSARIKSQIIGKTGFSFINEGGGKGGGGGGTIMFSPGSTMFSPSSTDTLKRRTLTLAREGDDEERSLN